MGRLKHPHLCHFGGLRCLARAGPAPGFSRESITCKVSCLPLDPGASLDPEAIVVLTSRVRLQVAVPELDLEVSTGTLGGLITTVEGLLDTIAQNLKNTQVRPGNCHVAHLFMHVHQGCLLAAAHGGVDGSATHYPEMGNDLTLYCTIRWRGRGCALQDWVHEEKWRPALQGFHLGDSAKHEQKRTWKTFFEEVERCKALETPWTLQLRDPLANSFVSSVLEDPRKDPRMQARLPTSAADEDWVDTLTLQCCQTSGRASNVGHFSACRGSRSQLPAHHASKLMAMRRDLWYGADGGL